MRRIPSNLAGILLGVAVSVAAIALAVRWAGLQALWDVLRQASYLVLIPAFGLYLVSMVARALAWQVILGGRVGLVRVTAALNEGYLLNNLLPWRLGELGRCVLLGRRPGLTPAVVLSSIVVERLLDMVLAVGLLISLGPVVLRVEWASRAALLGAGAIGLAVVVLALILVRPRLGDRIVEKLAGGSARWGAAWGGIRTGLAALGAPSRLLRAFGWMAVSWALAAVEYWIVLRGFVPEAPPLWALFALCISLLGVAIPSAPGYVGVFEASVVAALAVFGIASATGLAYAVVLHALHFGATTILGAIALASEGETVIGAMRAARSWAAGLPASDAK